MENEQLVLRIRAGEDPAGNMEQLYTQNRGLIKKLAKRYFLKSGKRCDPEDLMQESYFGLLEAVYKWDPDRGTAFITYAAPWIRQSMGRYIVEKCQDCRLPEWRRVRAVKYKRLLSDYARDHGRPPTAEELHALTGWKWAALEDVKRDAAHLYAVRLDKPIDQDDDGGATLADMLPDKGREMEEAEEDVDRRQLAVILWAAVDDLPPDQAQAIRERYQNGKTRKEAGAAMGVPERRAASLEKTGFRAIRNNPAIRRLVREMSDSAIYSRGLQRGDSTARTALKIIELEESARAIRDQLTGDS